jgi:ABC-2 type transport system ATP-binding protein
MSWGVEDLSVRFGAVDALRNITLAIRPGAVHAVVGGDGAGKTTLLRLLAGIGIKHSGRVTLPGSGRTGYVPPNGGVFADLSVDENMEFTADAYRLDSWQERSRTLLVKAGIAQFGGRPAGKLSGGQRRKLAGSMALLSQPDLLVLDEVTTGVDPVSRMDLWRLIAGAAASGAGVVVATSYLDEAERAGYVLLLHKGAALAAGEPTEVMQAVAGTVVDVAVPTEPSRAWRRGSGWRQWNPDAERGRDDRLSLEDVAIVSELIAEGASR